VFLNSHFTLGFPRPYFPNIIEVAGMHIKKKTNPLPDDIQKFIDDSESVIFFSLGGNLKSSAMPIEKQEAIIKSLTRVKERILLKWEDDENVKVNRHKFLVKKWFPQDDLLAHPKVKLFITHGGLLSGSEAVYHGKPLIVIPIFGDQKLNAARTELSGFGVRVDYANLTEKSLTWALNEVLMKEKYSTRVKELSKRFRDRPQHPVDIAKFYVEYVIKNKGAHFMQSSATHLNFIELHNLDVILIFAIALLLVLYIPYVIFKAIIRAIIGSNPKPEMQSQNAKKKVKKS
jgi:UDP:flavonoid glycosyltransferase YjiC (YdhE family)